MTRIDRVRDFVNDAYVDYLVGPDGEPDAARTADWKARIHADDVDRVIAGSLAGEASRKPFTLEGRYKRYDGEYRWLRSVSSPRFGPDGELVPLQRDVVEPGHHREADAIAVDQVGEAARIAVVFRPRHPPAAPVLPVRHHHRVGARIGVMRAVLGPTTASHPRAAATLMEGLALWHQRALSVVLCADDADDGVAMHLCDALGYGRALAVRARPIRAA